MPERGHHTEHDRPDQQSAHGLFGPGGRLGQQKAGYHLPQTQQAYDCHEQAGHPQYELVDPPLDGDKLLNRATQGI